jgi:hypothetical protein
MIREKEEKPSQPIVIDLSGPEGNVFCLMGYAKRFAQQLGLDGGAITSDMMSSDYDHAVEVFDRHFGDFVILQK